MGNVEEMSENAIKILQDETTLKQFKSNAKEQAQKFDISNIVPQYEAIYEETLRNSKE